LVPGDMVYSAEIVGSIPGVHAVPFTVADAQGRSSNNTISNVRVVSLTDLGALDTGDTFLDISIEPGEVKWFRFQIPEVSDVWQRWLDIYTMGTGDSEIGLYRADGTLVADDDDDGDGVRSALSFGLNNPARPPNGTGVAFNGRDGDLPEGEYYLAVGTFNTTFNTTDFNVTSTGPGGFFTIVLNLNGLTPRGSCCVAGECSVQTEADCGSMGGSYGGDGTNCGSVVYEITTTTEQFTSIAGFGNLAWGVTDCDDCTEQVFLPFTFTFFGESYNDVRISTNGNLQFGSSASTTYINHAIPSTDVPNNAIYPLWDDYNPLQQGDIYYAEDGVAPNRRFIVEWNNVTQYTALNTYPVTSETFQVILHEGTNNIEFRYGLISPVDTSGINQGSGQDASGGDRTIGVENADGTIAFSYPSASHFGESLLLTYVQPSNPLRSGLCDLRLRR
jgi:hypothetical protein